MKQKMILIFVIIMHAITNKAQTDSLCSLKIINEINEFRKEKSIKPLKLNQNINKGAKKILEKREKIKDSNGIFNKDSIRNILRENGIYDFQVEVIENKKTANSFLLSKNKEIPEFKKLILDSLQNMIGFSTNDETELVIMTKHFVDINPVFTAKVKAYFPEGSKYGKIENKSVTISGYTNNKNIIAYSFEYINNELNMPIDTLTIKKEMNGNFKIEINNSKTRQKIPKCITLKDSLGNVLSLITF